MDSFRSQSTVLWGKEVCHYALVGQVRSQVNIPLKEDDSC